MSQQRSLFSGITLSLLLMAQAMTAYAGYFFREVPSPEGYELIHTFPKTPSDAECSIVFNAPRGTAFIVDPQLQLFNFKHQTTGLHKPFLMKSSENQLISTHPPESEDDYFIAESNGMNSLVGMRVTKTPVKGISNCFSESVHYDAESLIPETLKVSKNNLKFSLNYAQTQVMFSAPNGVIYFRSQVNDPSYSSYCQHYNFNCSNVTRYGYFRPDGKGEYTLNFLYGGRGNGQLTQPTYRNTNRFITNYGSTPNNPESGFITTYYLILGDSHPYLFSNSNFNPVDLRHQAVGWENDRHFFGTTLAPLEQEMAAIIEVQIPGFDVSLTAPYKTATQQLCIGDNHATYGLPDDPHEITCKYFSGIRDDSDYYISRVWPGPEDSLFANFACLPTAKNPNCMPFTFFFADTATPPQTLASYLPELSLEHGMINPVLMNARLYDGTETLIVYEAKTTANQKTMVISNSGALTSSSSTLKGTGTLFVPIVLLLLSALAG